MKHKVDRTKNILQAFKKSIDKCLIEIGFGILEELDLISVLIQAFYPLLFLRIDTTPFYLLSFGVFMTFISRVLTRVYRNLTNVEYSDFPIPPREFTKRDIYGFIELRSKDDMPDILVYLNRVESYLKDHKLMEDEE